MILSMVHAWHGVGALIFKKRKISHDEKGALVLLAAFIMYHSHIY